MGVSRGGAGRRACVSAENTTPFVAASWKLQLQLYCLVWIKTWAASLKENHTCERSRSNYGAQFIPVTFSLILKRKVLLFFSFGEQKVKGATFLNPRRVSVWSIFSFFPHWCSCGQEKKIWIIFPCIRSRCCQCQVLFCQKQCQVDYRTPPPSPLWEDNWWDSPQAGCRPWWRQAQGAQSLCLPVWSTSPGLQHSAAASEAACWLFKLYVQ